MLVNNLRFTGGLTSQKPVSFGDENSKKATDQERMIELLLKAGVDVNKVDTPQIKDNKMVQLLLKAGADVNKVDTPQIEQNNSSKLTILA